MATSSTYCTQRDVEDIYPQVDEFDSKDPMYGWVVSEGDTYSSNGCGLVTQLFKDGENLGSQVSVPTGIIIGTASGTDIVLFQSTAHGLATGETVAITNHDYNDGTYVVSVSTVDIFNVPANYIGTDNDANWTKVLPEEYTDVVDDWYYDSTNDICYYEADTGVNPNDLLMESGEDFKTLMDRIMKNASRYLDARIDANLPRDQFKDKEGNYDYMIIRTSALLSAYFLINASEPNSPIANNFMEEANFNIDQFNSGKSRLSGGVTGDASKGIVREVVSPQNSNGLHIVDTRGHYTGIYDLLKVVINTAGVIGTAKFDVYGKSSDSLKSTKVIDALVINGQYQSIGNGLQIRFAGKDSSAEATLGATPDEWEVEAWGSQESIDDNIGQIRSVKMTRHGRSRRVFR